MKELLLCILFFLAVILAALGGAVFTLVYIRKFHPEQAVQIDKRLAEKYHKT